MKNIITCFIALLGLFMMESCKKTETNKVAENSVVAKKVALVKPTKATFKIEGMTCAVGCAKTIEEKLSETNGIENAKVDFESKTASLTFDASTFDQQKIAQLVESEADGNTYKVSEFSLVK